MRKLLLSILFCTSMYSLEKRLIVIVPSYNNEKWCDKNIKSILMQKYNNYKVIYVDDCSNDLTYEKVKGVIRKFDVEDRFILYKNSIRQGKAKNIWRTIHNLLGIDFSIKDNDIIVICDGDDWYNKDYAFSYINALFTEKDVWLTYGGCIDYPTSSENWSLDVPDFIVNKNEFRCFSRNTSQQRAFYAWLFKEIPLHDFIHKGKIVTTSSDVCKMFPMFEMAGEKFERLKSMIYVYNRADECLNDDKINSQLQYDIDHDMRKRKKYLKLNKPIFSDNKALKTAFCILEPDKNSIDLFIQQIKQKLIGDVDIYVYLKKDTIFKIMDPSCKICYFQNLKEEFQKIFDIDLYTHILITHDLRIPQKNIDINLVSYYLKATKAFYFDSLVETILLNSYDQLNNEVGIWQNNQNNKCVNQNNLTMKMYSIENLKYLFSNFEFGDFTTLQKKYEKISNLLDSNDISLFLI